MFIDYRASGTLLTAHRLYEGKFVILIHQPNDTMTYVVSTYTDGARQWDNGKYCKTFEDALKAFTRLIGMRLKVDGTLQPVKVTPQVD